MVRDTGRPSDPSNSEGVEPSGGQSSTEMIRARIEQLKGQIDTVKIEKEAAVAKKQEGLAEALTEHQTVQFEKQKVDAGIKETEAEIGQFMAVMQEAKAAGIAVEGDQAFTAAFQAEKNKLKELEQRQAELRANIETMASDPEAVAGIQQETEIKEKLTREVGLAKGNVRYAFANDKDGGVVHSNLDKADSYEALSVFLRDKVNIPHALLYEVSQNKAVIQRYYELRSELERLYK